MPAYPLGQADRNHVLLLLPNVLQHVHRERRENELFCSGHGICPFELQQPRFMEAIDSFMVDLYQKLFVGPSQLWKINISLIDYNLTRLRRCMDLYTKQTNKPALASMDELPLALEFFLQIDGERTLIETGSFDNQPIVVLHIIVDVFFMKTCRFRGSKPRRFGESDEGILCEEEPIAQYSLKPCEDKCCWLCQRRYGESGQAMPMPVDFGAQQSYRFVHKYETFLNCHAVSDERNVISILLLSSYG